MSNSNDSKDGAVKDAEKLKMIVGGCGENKEEEVPALYQISSSDSPGNVLIACQLNGDNYLTWSRAMRNALKAKKKLGFVDETIEKPEEDDPNYEHWEAWNSMLIAWIFNTMGKDLQATVAYADDVRKLWNDLKERYSQGNLARIYQLKSDICFLKQEGQSVAEYWGKMKGLWDELESYYDNSGCTCGANGAALMKWETEKSFQFLMGLHPEFNTV